MTEPLNRSRERTRLAGAVSAAVAAAILGTVASGVHVAASEPGATGPAPNWSQMGVALRPSLLPDATPAAPPSVILPVPPAKATLKASPEITPDRAPSTPPRRRTAMPRPHPEPPAKTSPAPAAATAWPVLPSAGRSKRDASPSKSNWSEAELKEAKALCKSLLAGMSVVAVPEDPVREGATGACGDPAPMRLMSIGKGPQQVVLSPPAVLSCPMVAALARWLDKDLQPLARKYLKTKITQIDVMSDYSCRYAYGRRLGRLSEHGKANALDIGVIRLADQSVVSVLAHWGPTQRDILAAKALAEKVSREKAKATKTTATSRQPNAVAAEPTSPSRPTAGRLPVGFTNPNQLGGPKKSAEADHEPTAGASTLRSRLFRNNSRNLTVADGARSRFLRAAHERGCRIFGTVLGPESNEAHRNHLHIDMAQRASGSYCR